MKIQNNKKSLLFPLVVGLSTSIWLNVVIYLLYKNDMLIGVDSVTWRNFGLKLFGDAITMLIIPAILIIINRKHLKEFGLNNESPKLVLILIFFLLLLLQFHKDFTVTGFYRFFYYLVIVAFAEEFIFRGYIYQKLKNSKVLAIILSGALWGIPHAFLPSLLAGDNVGQLLLAMLGEIGGGIIIGWFFIYLRDNSKSLWVAVLIHAILDYTVGYYGLLVAICTFLYFRMKNRPRREDYQV